MAKKRLMNSSDATAPKNINWLVSCVRDSVWDKYEGQDILKELQDLSLLQNLHIGQNETTFSLHPLIQD